MQKEINKKPLFNLGKFDVRRSAINAFLDARENPIEFLDRHQCGDWGDISERDKKFNEYGVQNDCQIVSRYELSTGIKIWIVTNRCFTTVYAD